MRLKEFIVFLIAFTIVYIVFFVIVDKISLKRSEENERKRILSYMDIQKYYKFANFYGIPSAISNQLLYSIFLDIQTTSTMKITTYGQKYQVSPYEFVVIVLYFEYYQLISKKVISYEEDTITQASYADQGLLYKYGPLFLSKSDYPKIMASMGNTAVGDLTYLNQKFLIPGIRIIGSNIFYVGDLNEKV